MACRYNAIFTNLMQCFYDDSNSSWPKTSPCVVICIVMTVETILVYFWNKWRSSSTFSMNENENKIFPSSHLLRKVFNGICPFSVEWWWWWRISRRWEFLGRLMISSCMLVGDRRVRFLMRRSAGGQSLLHSPCLNLIIGLGISLTRPILESGR